jgi:pimeloyl-ACP methyl ester carboxylesterase
MLSAGTWTNATVRRLGALALAVAVVLVAAPTTQAQERFDQNGMLFVHGFVGSGAQFESQKMRFMSNGYPDGWVAVIDYDSTFGSESRQQVFTRIDGLVAELKQRTGRPKVDVLAHSLGTSVMQEYLTSSPARAANVEHYVNIDGREADAPPGGVPTLAVWAGRGTPGREIAGATNVTIPNQTHVQTATSVESFVEYFKFFTGRAPAHDIVPEAGPITVAGRALLFPQNRALPAGATLEVWPVDSATGQRIGQAPTARSSLDQTGDFGPVPVEPGRSYEFVLLRPGVATLHYYYEPFVRSDHLLRLPYSDAVEALVQRSEGHVSGLVIRYKELWGDQGSESDLIALNGTNVCTAALCPVAKQVNALFFFDRGLDGRTDLSSPDPAFSQLPFITAADVFLPAARPPTGMVSASLTSRGAGPARTLTFPNFPSTADGAVLQFNDFEQPVGLGTPGPSGRSRCLPRRLAVRGRGIGPARLGGSYRAFARRYRATIRSRRFTHFCVRGGGRLVTRARRGRIDFVATTARGHRRRAYRPGRRVRGGIRGTRRIRSGLLAGRRQGRGRPIYGVRRGRIRFIAVVPFRQVDRERLLVRRLQAAGLVRAGR